MEWRCNCCNWFMEWLVFCWIKLAVLWKHRTFKLIFGRCPGALRLSNQQKPQKPYRFVPWCGVSWCWCRQNSKVFEFWWGKMAKNRGQQSLCLMYEAVKLFMIYYPRCIYVRRYLSSRHYASYWSNGYMLCCFCAGLLLACAGRE